MTKGSTEDRGLGTSKRVVLSFTIEPIVRRDFCFSDRWCVDSPTWGFSIVYESKCDGYRNSYLWGALYDYTVSL